jgi:hypothetical protein
MIVMTNNNGYIETDNSVNTEDHKPLSWFGAIIEKIEDVIYNMDTDFPLSGGEEHPVHHKHHH